MSEEILARGGFRLDRRRALEKMEKFQLADPWAWVLELVAAAVAAQATAVHFTTDADDVWVRWDGALLTRAELDGLFDALFGHAGSPRERLLQHLAIGVLGALGRGPKWVHVLRGPHAEAGEPALRMAVDDPAETRAEEHGHDEVGTTIHVRLAIGIDVLGRALSGLFLDRPEVRLLRARAGWCPIPVFLDGKSLVPPIPSRALLGGQELWLVKGSGAIDLVRGGVTVGAVRREFTGFAVVGAHRDDTLVLDASRGAPVEDEVFRAANAALDARIAALLPALEVDPDAQLQAACWLAERKAPLGALERAPIVPTLEGRRWTLEQVHSFAGPKGYLDDPALADATVLAFDPADKPRLTPLLPDLGDLTVRLRARAEGRVRRAKAEANPLRPSLGITAQRTFDASNEPPASARAATPGISPENQGHPRGAEGSATGPRPIRGAVAWREAPGAMIEVHLRRAGAEVERLQVPSPAGPMIAVLDHPGFAVDEDWRHVLDTPEREEAFALLQREALAFAAEEMERATRGATGGPAPATTLEAALRALGAKARADLAAILAANPDHPVLAGPAFAGGDGRWHTLREVLAGTGWILAAELPLGCPRALAARVLLVPDPGAWTRWLGERAEDGTKTLPEEVRGATRRAAARVEPRLPPQVSRRVAISAEGWTGEVGLGDASWVLARTGAVAGTGGPIGVLRAGIPVCTLAVDAGIERLIGVVDHPSAAVNRAHDTLTAGAEGLTRAVVAAAGELMRQEWEADGPTDAVLRWLTRGAPQWASDKVLVATLAGEPWTLAALRAHGEKRNVPKLKLLSRDPGTTPGFGGAIVARPALRDALRALAPAAVRDGDEELAGAERNLAAYLARPAAAPVVSLRERRDDEVTWVLPADPERAGVLKVEARWRDRTLTAWERGNALGAWGIIEGPSVVPAASLSGLADPNLLSRWSKRARSVVAGLVDEALDARDGVPEGEAAAWRALLARLDDAKDRSAAEEKARTRLMGLPLFPRLDGTWVARSAVPSDAWLVSPRTEPGATDTPWYLLDVPWVRAAGRLQDGTKHLEEWRGGQRRKAGAARREATVVGPTLARTPLKVEGLVGEVALIEGEPGVRVTPLVEGVALQESVVPAPFAAAAVVKGPAVQADRGFTAWVESPARALAFTRIVEAARALAFTTAAAPEARVLPWLVAWALRDPAAADVAIFPLAWAEEDAPRASSGSGAVDGAVQTPSGAVVAAQDRTQRRGLGPDGMPGGGAGADRTRRATPGGTHGRTAGFRSAADATVPMTSGGTARLESSTEGANADDASTYQEPDRRTDSSSPARASARQVLARGRLGVVAEAVRLVAGPPPVVAPEWMRTLLAEKITVVDLHEVVERHRRREAPRAVVGGSEELLDGAKVGEIAWGEGEVEVRREGVRLVTLTAAEQGAMLPLTGWIAADAEVDAAWTALVPADLAAVQARLLDLSRRLVARALEGRGEDGASESRVGASESTGETAVSPGYDAARGLAKTIREPGASEPRVGAVARAALFALLANGSKERSDARLRAMAEDPLVARLLTAPLFRDSNGASGSLQDLLDGGTIHAVAPGSVGRTAPEDPRFWQIPEVERVALATLRPVVDAEELLVSCTKGAWRREAQREPPPKPEEGALVVDLWDGQAGDDEVRGQLWLGAGGLVVRVAGCRVETREPEVPGLSGWVEGPFPTDPAFTSARLPPKVKAALHTATVSLLGREAPERVLRRAAAAVTAAGSVDKLLEDADSAWNVVALFRDPKGAGIPFADLLRMRKNGTFVVGPPGATLARKGLRLIVGGPDVVHLLRAWFPTAEVLTADDLAAQVETRKNEKGARRAVASRNRHQREVLEAATRHLAEWTGAKPGEELGKRVAAWAAGQLRDWPPIETVEADGPWPALLAFAVAAGVADAAVRKRACEGVAGVLGAEGS